MVRVNGTAPEGATIAYTGRYSNEVERILEKEPEVDSVLIINGLPEVHRFIVIGRLKDWDDRERRQQEIVRKVSPDLRRIAGVNAYANNPPSLGASNNSRPIEYVLQTSGTYEQLDEYVNRFLERIHDYPGLASVETDLKLNKPEISITIDRAKAADLGIDVAVLGRTLESLLGGRQVTRFEVGGEQYDVMVQLDARDRASPGTLDTIYLRSSGGQMVQLNNLVNVRETVAPQELRRFNQLRSATISANLAPGYRAGRGARLPRPGGARRAAADRADRRLRPAAANSAPPARAWCWCSCWRWASSIWCSRRSSRASATRSSSC